MRRCASPAVPVSWLCASLGNTPAPHRPPAFRTPLLRRCARLPASAQATRSPSQFDLELRLAVLDLELDLEPDLVRHARHEPDLPALEHDVVSRRELVRDLMHTSSRLLTRDGRLLLELEQFHAMSFQVELTGGDATSLSE